MVRLVDCLKHIAPSKVMLIGDFLLDAYTIGKVKRISPEAPVSVLQVEKEEKRPGGAGNAVLNLLSLGCEVVAVGRVGRDSGGIFLRDSLYKEGVDIRGLLVDNTYQTPIKNRIIAENQQMMRIDFENVLPVSDALENEIIEILPSLMDDVKVIAISDYAKGFLTHQLLRKMIDLAISKEILVIVDPKGIDFSKYHGASIIKPNLHEAIVASGLLHDTQLEKMADKLLKDTGAQALLITRSEAGISLFEPGKKQRDFPVHAREVKDVTGAGDTVLATLAMALANGFGLDVASMLANCAAGIAIEHFGCARVSLSQIAKRLLHQDATNKIFDEEQLFALHLAIKDSPFTLLSIEGNLGMTSSIFKSIRELAFDKVGELIVYVRSGTEDEEFLNLLASLQEVDFIILKSDDVDNLCMQIKPEEMYVLQGNKLEKVLQFHPVYK